jgi:hypothetical protein
MICHLVQISLKAWSSIGVFREKWNAVVYIFNNVGMKMKMQEKNVDYLNLSVYSFLHSSSNHMYKSKQDIEERQRTWGINSCCHSVGVKISITDSKISP